MRLLRANFKLLGQLLRSAEGTFLDQADGGHVGQGSRDTSRLRGKGARLGPEDVHRSDGHVAQPQREAVCGLETEFGGPGSEGRPAVVCRGDQDVGNFLARAMGVQTRPLGVLELEQLQQAGILARRRHEPERVVVVREHQTGGTAGGDLRGTAGHMVQKVDQIKLVDQRVGDLDEEIRQATGADLISSVCRDPIHLHFFVSRHLKALAGEDPTRHLK